MILSVYGAGYVGLVSAVCLSSMGHKVLCADINKQRITRLNHGECPIYEDQLPELLKQQLLSGRLSFTADTAHAIFEGDIHFIATGTPSLPDGRADLSQVFTVARQIAAQTRKDTLIVTKSTVPVGTGDQILALVLDEQRQVKSDFKIDVVSNPEFLREGSAVHDFLNADRILLGGDEEALKPLQAIYQPLADKGIPILNMSRQSAELAKYSANAMLACRISFINQISRIAEQFGANIEDIRVAMGMDPRIGEYFLQAGIGYGGSCFPKDNRALIHTAKELGINSALLEATESINDLQKEWVFEKLSHHFNNHLGDKTIAIWGLSFKPDTDDLREASSLVIIEALIKAGAKLILYDPVAMPAAKEILIDSTVITWSESAGDAIEQPIDALVIATEWEEFKNFSLNTLAKKLKEAPLIDGRNCYKLSNVASSGIHYYYSVGRPLIETKRQTL